MNKWRHVSTDRDYNNECQCLNCKATWTGGINGGWKFCPSCGIKFAGQHECIAHDERRSELWGKMKRLEPYFYWLVESRFVYPGEDAREWKPDRAKSGFIPARQVWDYVRTERAHANRFDDDFVNDFGPIIEYRVRTVREVPQYTHVSPYYGNGGMWDLAKF